MLSLVPALVAGSAAALAAAPAALPRTLTLTGAGAVAVDLDGAVRVVGIERARRPLLGGAARGVPVVAHLAGEAWAAEVLPAPDGWGGWEGAPVSDAQATTTEEGKAVVSLLAHRKQGDALVVCEDEGDGWACAPLPLPAGAVTSPSLGLDAGYWSLVAHWAEDGGDRWAGIVRWEEGMTEMERWARVGDGVTGVARVHGAADPAVVYRLGSRVVLLDHTDQERTLGPSGDGDLVAAATPDGAVALAFDAVRRTAFLRDGARRHLDGPVAGERVAAGAGPQGGVVAWSWRDTAFSGGVRAARVGADGLGEAWTVTRDGAGPLALGLSPDGVVAVVAPGTGGGLVVRTAPSIGALQAAAAPPAGDWTDTPRPWGVRVGVGAAGFSRGVQAGAPGGLSAAEAVPFRGDTLRPPVSIGATAEGRFRAKRLRGAAAWSRRGPRGALGGEQRVEARVGMERLGTPWLSVDLGLDVTDIAAVPVDGGAAVPVSTRAAHARIGLPGGAWVGPAAGLVRAGQDVYEMDDGEAVASSDTDALMVHFGGRAGWQLDPDPTWERPKHVGPRVDAWVGAGMVTARFDPLDEGIDGVVVGGGMALEAGLDLGVEATWKRRQARGAGLAAAALVRARGSYLGQPRSSADLVFQRLDRSLVPVVQVGGAF